MTSSAMTTAEGMIQAPLLYKGKVRELYDLGDRMLIVVTDRISAFDYVLRPAVPDKGNVLNRLSAYWFGMTSHLQTNHLIHTDVAQLAGIIPEEHVERLKHRIMVVRKAERIDMECVVRGYLAGGGWRQYQHSGEVNGAALPGGLRKNSKLEAPLFTPAAKNDVGHDEDISVAQMAERIGRELAEQLQEKSLNLYRYAQGICEQKGIILADCKFEFGLLDGKVILIDELFTPDSSRFWATEQYALDTEIASMDKEPVRHYLAHSGWDMNSEPEPLPDGVVEQTSRRYREIYRRITGQAL